MPRSAADATRFTATGPHAHSKISSGTTIDVGTPPANENPSQKVVRLRAAAQRARLASQSGTRWDRIVARGRVWADRAHYVTAVGLIGISAVAGVYAAVAFTDMALYNRRKRKAFYEEQQANYENALAMAKRAEAAGNLTEDLALVLQKERALEEVEREKREKVGIWDKTKSFFMTGPKEELPGGQLGSGEIQAEVNRAMHSNGRSPQERQLQSTTGTTAIMSMSAPLQNGSNSHRGGTLDQLGESAAASVSASSKGWLEWLRGR